MKKISLLIALAICVTIGGVYATWNYNSQTAVNTSHEHMTVSMGDYVAGENAKGSIKEVKNDMRVEIDDTNNDYVAELAFSGEMVFVFMPYSQSGDALTNGIPMQYTLSQSGSIAYEGTNVFSITEGPYDLVLSEKITATNATTIYTGVDLSAYVGGFAVRVQGSDLDGKIVLGGSFSLPTLDDYHDFEATLGLGQLGLTVSAKLD